MVGGDWGGVRRLDVVCQVDLSFASTGCLEMTIRTAGSLALKATAFETAQLVLGLGL